MLKLLTMTLAEGLETGQWMLIWVIFYIQSTYFNQYRISQLFMVWHIYSSLVKWSCKPAQMLKSFPPYQQQLQRERFQGLRAAKRGLEECWLPIEKGKKCNLGQQTRLLAILRWLVLRLPLKRYGMVISAMLPAIHLFCQSIVGRQNCSLAIIRSTAALSKISDMSEYNTSELMEFAVLQIYSGLVMLIFGKILTVCIMRYGYYYLSDSKVRMLMPLPVPPFIDDNTKKPPKLSQFSTFFLARSTISSFISGNT